MRTEPHWSWVRFLIGGVLIWGVLAGVSEIDATGRWGLITLVLVAGTAVVVEMVVFKTPARTAVRFLGLGRPRRTAVVVAAVVSGLILLIYPLASAVLGIQFALVDNWPWILLGLFCFHGLAEEIVWRGYIFRRLNDGRRFRTAVLLTMPFIAAAHIPIFINNGPVVAVGAMLVAAVTSVPCSYLYVAGGRTVWAPALLHTAIDSFKLVIIPAAATQSFSLLLIGFSLLVPLLVLASPRIRRAPLELDPGGVSSRGVMAHSDSER